MPQDSNRDEGFWCHDSGNDITCDQVCVFSLKEEGGKNAWYIYWTSRQPPPHLNKLRCGQTVILWTNQHPQEVKLICSWRDLETWISKRHAISITFALTCSINQVHQSVAITTLTEQWLQTHSIWDKVLEMTIQPFLQQFCSVVR